MRACLLSFHKFSNSFLNISATNLCKVTFYPFQCRGCPMGHDYSIGRLSLISHAQVSLLVFCANIFKTDFNCKMIFTWGYKFEVAFSTFVFMEFVISAWSPLSPMWRNFYKSSSPPRQLWTILPQINLPVKIYGETSSTSWQKNR